MQSEGIVFEVTDHRQEILQPEVYDSLFEQLSLVSVIDLMNMKIQMIEELLLNFTYVLNFLFIMALVMFIIKGYRACTPEAPLTQIAVADNPKVDIVKV